MLSKRLRRKGISPVIANAVLLFGVLVSGIAIWWFAISRTAAISESYAVELSDSMMKLEERFVVEHIQTNSTNFMKVWVYNYCKIGVTVTKIYAESNYIAWGWTWDDDNDIWDWIGVGPPLDLPEEIPVGELKVITAYIGYTPGPEYFVQVESERGNVVIGSN